MTTIRTIIRGAAIMAATASLVMMSTQYAGASTSHEFVYHAAGNTAGEVWFNSGWHAGHAGHAERGFNSFAIKDQFCGDGWGIGVQWQLSDEVFNYQGTKDCDPVEVTYETGQASSIVIEFNWRPFMWAVDGQHEPEYGAWHSDWMGSDSVDDDAVFFVRTSVYNDVLGDGRTFAASMWPTTLARLAGGNATSTMMNMLQERTPLPSSLTDDQRESLYKQLWCHAEFARHPELGEETWDIESERPNIPWWRVVALLWKHKCNW